MDSRVQLAKQAMDDFAARTGLESRKPGARYLWTDAFAVCNFLGLARATGEGRYLELALELVDQVHRVLGRYRDDDARRGSLSGLSDEEAARHPTRGGLRIGKPLPERRSNEAFDPELEWERDGQYFHYLTRWMHALDQLARFTGQAHFNAWALELADVACTAFVRGGRMAWKLSTDLSRALVPSMGQHDPLDGFVTVAQLRATAARFGNAAHAAERVEATFAQLLAAQHELGTDDALGIGGLLTDAFRYEQVRPGARLTDTLLSAALEGLEHTLQRNRLDGPLTRRLAFRELGLAIGLRAADLLGRRRGEARSPVLAAVCGFVPVAERLERTWAEPRAHQVDSWRQHLDINQVMLATALAPEGYVLLEGLMH